jgi:hypothetical protein
MGDLSDFERGQIVDAYLSGASETKTATLSGVSRATVCMNGSYFVPLIQSSLQNPLLHASVTFEK